MTKIFEQSECFYKTLNDDLKTQLSVKVLQTSGARLSSLSGVVGEVYAAYRSQNISHDQ